MDSGFQARLNILSLLSWNGCLVQAKNRVAPVQKKFALAK